MIIKSVVNSITMKLMSLFHHIMFPIKLIEDILKELSNHKEPCPGCNGYIEFGLYLKSLSFDSSKNWLYIAANKCY